MSSGGPFFPGAHCLRSGGNVFTGRQVSAGGAFPTQVGAVFHEGVPFFWEKARFSHGSPPDPREAGGRFPARAKTKFKGGRKTGQFALIDSLLLRASRFFSTAATRSVRAGATGLMG